MGFVSGLGSLVIRDYRSIFVRLKTGGIVLSTLSTLSQFPDSSLLRRSLILWRILMSYSRLSMIWLWI